MKRNNDKTPPSGKCKICGINLYADKGNKPDIMPCGIHRNEKEKCPYETVSEYEKAMLKWKPKASAIGTGLAQI